MRFFLLAFFFVVFSLVFVNACGEGDISYHTSNDEATPARVRKKIDQIDLEDAMEECKKDEECSQNLEALADSSSNNKP